MLSALNELGEANATGRWRCYWQNLMVQIKLLEYWLQKKKKINIFNVLFGDNELNFQCHVVKSCALNLAFAELTRVWQGSFNHFTINNILPTPCLVWLLTLKQLSSLCSIHDTPSNDPTLGSPVAPPNTNRHVREFETRSPPCHSQTPVTLVCICGDSWANAG